MKSKTEQISEVIKSWRMLEPHLRDKSIYPDEKLPFTVKSSIRNLEIEVAAIRFGLDSLQFRHACARMDEVIKEEMEGRMPG